jgi:hypothetical protein
LPQRSGSRSKPWCRRHDAILCRQKVALRCPGSPEQAAGWAPWRRSRLGGPVDDQPRRRRQHPCRVSGFSTTIKGGSLRSTLSSALLRPAAALLGWVWSGCGLTDTCSRVVSVTSWPGSAPDARSARCSPRT